MIQDWFWRAERRLFSVAKAEFAHCSRPKLRDFYSINSHICLNAVSRLQTVQHKQLKNTHIPTFLLHVSSIFILRFHSIIHHTTGIKMSDIMTLRTGNTRNGCVKYDPGRAKLSCRLNFFTLRPNTLYNQLQQKGTIHAHLCSFENFWAITWVLSYIPKCFPLCILLFLCCGLCSRLFCFEHFPLLIISLTAIQ